MWQGSRPPAPRTSARSPSRNGRCTRPLPPPAPRPSMISGNPVYSSIGRVPIPASESSRAVPPVETISIPSSASPRAKSTSPRLSDTLRSARRTRTAPGWVTAAAWPSVVPTGCLLHDHPSWICRIDPHAARGNQPHRLGQKAVLDLVDASLHGGDVTRIRNGVEGFLQDDRAAVDTLVHEVHGDPHDLHPVVECLLDRVHSSKGRQERRTHVDDPPSESAHELRAEQLRVPRQPHRLRAG